jgi:hypothetical protein
LAIAFDICINIAVSSRVKPTSPIEINLLDKTSNRNTQNIDYSGESKSRSEIRFDSDKMEYEYQK